MSHDQSHINPPKWVRRLLIWFCDNELVEAIDGDLLEAFQADVETHGNARARWAYFLNVFKFLKPQFMQRLSKTPDYAPQFGNYLKISLRNMQKHKLVALINLGGFTIGLSVLIFVALYLKYELSADRFVPDVERVYRINRGFRSQVYANLPFLNYYQSDVEAQQAFIKEFQRLPQVEAVAQFTTSDSQILDQDYYIEVNDKRVAESKILFTNTPKAFQEIFNWQVLAGNLAQPLLSSVVLTKSEAIKLFEEDSYLNAIGESVRLNEKDFFISAIIEDVPENAHFDFELAVFIDRIPNTWGAYTYVRVKEGTDPVTFLATLNEAGNLIDPDRIADPLEKGYFLQPITDIHLGSDHLYELETNTNPVYLILFGITGLLVMLITIANYVNLSVALYSNRLREIGVRKVIGAQRRDIRRQFLFEALFNSLVSLPIALFIVHLLMPYFNQLMGLNLDIEMILQSRFLISLCIGVMIVGMISGIYPALFLSGKPLLNLIHNRMGHRGKGFTLRKWLIGSQFFLLVLLCGFSGYVRSQMNYLNNKDLGFEKEGVVYFDVSNVENFKRIKTELEGLPKIKAIGHGSVPGNNMFNNVAFRFEGIEEIFDDANQLYMDKGAALALGLSSDAIRLLDEGKELVYLVNKTTARRYAEITGNSKEELIGKRFIEAPLTVQEDGTEGYPQVIDGIIADFNYFSLKESYNPLTVSIYNETDWVFAVIARVETEGMFETIEKIEQVYSRFEIDQPFNLYFLEDRIASLYADDNRIVQLVTVLAILAVILAYLGLIGITYYTAKMRQKEVAIRKVFGARAEEILKVMSKEFISIASIALVVCIPVTLFWANRWLDEFAFRIEVGPVRLVLIGLMALLVMLSGVLLQSYKTAKKNPVEPLRTES